MVFSVANCATCSVIYPLCKENVGKLGFQVTLINNYPSVYWKQLNKYLTLLYFLFTFKLFFCCCITVNLSAFYK